MVAERQLGWLNPSALPGKALSCLDAVLLGLDLPAVVCVAQYSGIPPYPLSLRLLVSDLPRSGRLLSSGGGGGKHPTGPILPQRACYSAASGYFSTPPSPHLSVLWPFPLSATSIGPPITAAAGL